MKNRICAIFFFFIFLISIIIPVTGTIQQNLTGGNPNQQSPLSNEPYDGYVLYTPEFTTLTLIINTKGETMHSWESESIQGLPVYLLENGNLIRGYSSFTNTRFIAGGVTGRVEILDWNNTQLWDFSYSTSQYCLHHDIEILPNGNILMTSWNYKTAAEAIQAGRNPNTLHHQQLWPDSIIEVRPTGSTNGDIVWEWHVWDHLIQDYDPEKDNYGIIADHPELIDINSGGWQHDMNHINSIDYHEEMDQILLSSHNQNEIWIIDHSTTSEEAAGHTGGRYGKGGDLLYRWGNPAVYDHDDFNDQQLFGQHDAQWIETDCPGEGNILIFNNGQNRPDGQYTSIVEIEPPIQQDGSYNYQNNTSFLPELPCWMYIADPPNNFYAPKISGAQRLSNGNTIICSGDAGYFFEIDSDGKVIWEYQNELPFIGKKNVFKIRKYDSDYTGLLFLSHHPDQPNKPEGCSNGYVDTIYQYCTNTTDPNNDDLYYLFDWGDGTVSDWIGPVQSGSYVNATHSWSGRGVYEVRVKAKDINELESQWSDPLSTRMPKNKSLHAQSFINSFLTFYDELFWRQSIYNKLYQFPCRYFPFLFS